MDYISIEWSSSDMKPISWNSLYSQKHWTYRKKLKDSWRNFFTERLNQFDKMFAERFEVQLIANSRADIDNIGIMAKFFVDSLNNMGWIIDDSPKYYKKISIISDKENMKPNTFKITYKPL